MSPSGLPDLTAFRDEWSVLFECASPAFDTHRLVELSRSADWSRVLVLAEEHSVLGHLAGRLCTLEHKFVPAEIRRTLVERHRLQVLSTLRMTAELFRVLELFNAKGIPSLAVKGPVLAMQAYGDPTVRSYSDLDFLVRQPDIRRATECLQSAGFEATVPLSAIDAGKIPGQYLFAEPGANLLVELHNDLTLRYFPRRLPLDKLFERHISVQLDGLDVPALAVEDHLVYICVHGATHFWERLSWIADVAALITRQAGLDWMHVRKAAKEVGAERMLHMGLCLASDLLRARLSDRLLAAVRGDKGAAKLAASASKWLFTANDAVPSLFERAAFRLRMSDGILTAPTYLLRLTLSPTEEDWRGGGEISHNRLLEAICRPFRLARKYGRDVKD